LPPTSWKIFQQSLVSVAALELCLPHMMMCINETRRYDFASTINILSPWWRVDFSCDFGNPFAFNQQRMTPQGLDMVVRLTQGNQNGRILKNV